MLQAAKRLHQQAKGFSGNDRTDRQQDRRTIRASRPWRRVRAGRPDGQFLRLDRKVPHQQLGRVPACHDDMVRQSQRLALAFEQGLHWQRIESGLQTER